MKFGHVQAHPYTTYKACRFLTGLWSRGKARGQNGADRLHAFPGRWGKVQGMGAS